MSNAETSRECPRCGGERVNVLVSGGLGEFTAVRYERGERRKHGKGLVYVTGVACTSCGWIELFASEPERLLRPPDE